MKMEVSFNSNNFSIIYKHNTIPTIMSNFLYFRVNTEDRLFQVSSSLPVLSQLKRQR